MKLETGRHARRWCPVEIPAVEAGAMVRVGECELPVQRVGEHCCFLLDAAPAGAALPLAMVDGTPDGGVTVTEVAPGVMEFQLDGVLFTAYHFGAEGNRPFLYPLLGPAGVGVTRNYPMLPDAPGENRDHPHHRSVWTAHGDVNGHDDWAEGPEMARIEHRAFTAVESGPVLGRLVEELAWVTATGAPLLSETREIRVYHTPADFRFIDWTVTLHADAGPVRLGDTKEGGMLSVRVATEMDASTNGTIENAWGARGEAECWGKPAAWCDYSGPVAGTTAGIAVFDAPRNPRFPTSWHVRDYGLMTANIFGQHTFAGDDPAVNGDLLIQAGASLTFAYRLYIHPGDATAADVAGRYLDYAYPPIVADV